jgi:hypothetical protein
MNRDINNGGIMLKLLENIDSTLILKIYILRNQMILKVLYIIVEVFR